MNYNRVILVGRLTRDPELRTTPDGVSLVRCRIAVNRRTSGEEADFFDFVAFRQNADFLANYATKGRLVLIEGRLQSRSYTDREGIRRTAYEIMTERVRLLDRPREAETEIPAQAAVGAPSAAPATPRPVAPSPEPEPPEDIELPEEFEEAFEEDFDVEGDPFEEMR
jgi:single-strand DNA-binding protein